MVVVGGVVGGVIVAGIVGGGVTTDTVGCGGAAVVAGAAVVVVEVAGGIKSSESSLLLAQNIRPITRPMMSRAATTVMARRTSRGTPEAKGLLLLGGETPPGETGVLPVAVLVVLPVILEGTDQAGDVGG